MKSATPPASADDSYMEHLSDLRRQVEQESAHGRALVADIGDNPVATLLLDSDVPCINFTWRGYATDLQIRYVHEVTLVLIRNHRIARILADNTKLQAFGDDVRRWIAGDWTPRAALAGLRVVAATEPVSVFASQPLQQLVTMLGAPLPVRFFTDPGAAREWLRGYSPPV